LKLQPINLKLTGLANKADLASLTGHQAKTNLSKLIAPAEAGEAVDITRGNQIGRDFPDTCCTDEGDIAIRLTASWRRNRKSSPFR
jgi:hypothetical protein